MASDPRDPYDLGIVFDDYDSEFPNMQSSSSVSSSSTSSFYSSTPSPQTVELQQSDYKEQRKRRDKRDKKNYQQRRNRDQQCEYEKNKHNEEVKDPRTDLKAVAKKEIKVCDYFVHEDEINFLFRYRSKAELNSYVKRGYEVASFLSFAGILTTFTDAVERAGLDDVFMNSSLVGSVQYTSQGKSTEMLKEKRATNLLECDLATKSPLLWDFEVEEYTPTKFEGRKEYWDARWKEIWPYLKMGKEEFKSYMERDLNMRQMRISTIMRDECFKVETAFGRSYSLKTRMIILEYLGEDDCMDSLADNVLACFNNFKTQLHVRHVIISMSLFYNLKQQFLTPNVEEKTLLKNIVDVAIRSGASNIPVDQGNIAYETALYTYWFILHKLSTEFRFTQVQTDRFVERLNIQSP